MYDSSWNVFASIMVFVFALTFVLGFIFLVGFIWWGIFAKTGYSGALGLLMFVPLANIVMLLILAFSEWPIERDLKQLKSAS